MKTSSQRQKGVRQELMLMFISFSCEIKRFPAAATMSENIKGPYEVKLSGVLCCGCDALCR